MDRPAKDALYDGLAAVARALGNGRRAELVDLLSQGERHVEELAHEVGQSVANTSQHLQVLRRVSLVRTRREGTRVLYALADPAVAALWREVRDVAARQVPGMEERAVAYLGDRRGLPVVDRDQLLGQLDAKDVLVLDVRPEPEFRSGHLPGAVNVPPDDLAVRLAALPPTAAVVAYCRGPFCAYADQAVRLLIAAGRDARRLVDGFPEWAAEGLPIVAG